MRPLWPKAMNVIGFQTVWLACVAGAGHGDLWLGPVLALAFVAATLRFGDRARADLRMLMISLPLGFALDSALSWSGWLIYRQPWPWQFAAPVWIWGLWLGFAMTLNHSLAFLRDRPLLATLLGLFGGPMAYWSAAGAFDAIEFGAPVAWVMIAIALTWALVLPALFAIDRRIERHYLRTVLA